MMDFTKDIYTQLEDFDPELRCSDVQNFFREYVLSNDSPDELLIILILQHLKTCPRCLQTIGGEMGEDYTEKVLHKLLKNIKKED